MGNNLLARVGRIGKITLLAAAVFAALVAINGMREIHNADRLATALSDQHRSR